MRSNSSPPASISDRFSARSADPSNPSRPHTRIEPLHQMDNLVKKCGVDQAGRSAIPPAPLCRTGKGSGRGFWARVLGEGFDAGKELDGAQS